MVKQVFLRGVIKVTGILMIVTGIAGLFLPFIQGILFIVIGFVFLSLTSPSVKGFVDRHLVNFPKVKSVFDKYYEKLAKALIKP